MMWRSGVESESKVGRGHCILQFFDVCGPGGYFAFAMNKPRACAMCHAMFSSRFQSVMVMEAFHLFLFYSSQSAMKNKEREKKALRNTESFSVYFEEKKWWRKIQ